MENKSFWTNQEVSTIVDDNTIEIIKFNDANQKVDFVSLSTSDQMREIFEVIERCPLIVSDHGGMYDLRDGHMLYIMDNGMIGFGVRGECHSINQVRIQRESNKVYVSALTIGACVTTNSRSIKDVRKQLNMLNMNEYASCKVEKIIYFAD